MSTLKALWEVLKATPSYWLARLNAKRNPCPPHEWTKWNFCSKCGEYR